MPVSVGPPHLNHLFTQDACSIRVMQLSKNTLYRFESSKLSSILPSSMTTFVESNVSGRSNRCWPLEYPPPSRFTLRPNTMSALRRLLVACRGQISLLLLTLYSSSGGVSTLRDSMSSFLPIYPRRLLHCGLITVPTALGQWFSYRQPHAAKRHCPSPLSFRSSAGIMSPLCFPAGTPLPL